MKYIVTEEFTKDVISGATIEYLTAKYSAGINGITALIQRAKQEGKLPQDMECKLTKGNSNSMSKTEFWEELKHPMPLYYYIGEFGLEKNLIFKWIREAIKVGNLDSNFKLPTSNYADSLCELPKSPNKKVKDETNSIQKGLLTKLKEYVISYQKGQKEYSLIEIEEMKRIAEQLGGIHENMLLANIYLRMSQPDLALQVLEGLQNKEDISSGQSAIIADKIEDVKIQYIIQTQVPALLAKRYGDFRNSKATTDTLCRCGNSPKNATGKRTGDT